MLVVMVRTSLWAQSGSKAQSRLQMMLDKSSESWRRAGDSNSETPWGHGFQDDSAVIPNPPSFQSSRRVRSPLALADVGPRGALLGARGHRMGTSEKMGPRVG